jgi:low temperature requirement protein LtrA
MMTLWQKPKLHEDPHKHRKVSWLELFFDLVFVVVISELVHLLSSQISVDRLWNYLLLFIPAWWIWIGATYYNDRFETEGLDSCFFTFLLIIPVIGLAIFAHHIPHAFSFGSVLYYKVARALFDHPMPYDSFSFGYVLCYILARALNVLMWGRASFYEKRFRPVGVVLMAGYGVSILLFLISFWCPESIRFVIWAVALLCDLITPLFTLNRQKALPSFNMTKLPERLALFTLIVIGETLVGVIQGIARHHHISMRVISEGILGVAISFTLWWIYFFDIADKPPKEQAKQVFLWGYLHLGLVMAIGAVGASLLNVLTSKHHIPADETRWLLTVALGVSLIFCGLIEFLLKSSDKTHVRMTWISALAILAIGFWGHELHAFNLLGLILLGLMIPIGHRVYRWAISSEVKTDVIPDPGEK